MTLPAGAAAPLSASSLKSLESIPRATDSKLGPQCYLCNARISSGFLRALDPYFNPLKIRSSLGSQQLCKLVLLLVAARLQFRPSCFFSNSTMVPHEPRHFSQCKARAPTPQKSPLTGLKSFCKLPALSLTFVLGNLDCVGNSTVR